MSIDAERLASGTDDAVVAYMVDYGVSLFMEIAGLKARSFYSTAKCGEELNCTWLTFEGAAKGYNGQVFPVEKGDVIGEGGEDARDVALRKASVHLLNG